MGCSAATWTSCPGNAATPWPTSRRSTASIDGWWAEGFDGTNGWAIANEQNDEDGDQPDADSIYDTLERDIIPRYYRVDGDGMPAEWVTMMKAAMRCAGARFSARRMVKEYATKFYSPALKKIAAQ